MITPQNGFLDGNGVSPYGAHADHGHDYSGDYAPINHKHDDLYEPKNAALLKAVKLTIVADDWEEGAATVSQPEGITKYINYVVDFASASAANTAEFTLTEVGDDTFTFEATTTPEVSIDVWILFI